MKHFYCQRGKLCRYGGYLLLFFLLLWAWKPLRAQGYLVFQGRVLSNADQEPLPGASVHIKGSRQGTTTDASGMFTYSTTDSKVGLRVSFIGYHILDTLVSLPLARELVLALSPDEAMLEEVKVSTGYWESSKRLSTGNISKVTAEVIEKQPVNNPLAALIGRMPGVNIQQQNGIPGGNFNIMIRGRNSIRPDGNAPLYLVDGVPFTSSFSSAIGGLSYGGGVSPLNSINPSDIESIEVLKDADATAVYGSRGANGVVLITTKKGRAGRTKAEINYMEGFSKVGGFMELLNTPQYLDMRKEAFSNDGIAPTPTNARELLVWDQERQTDWQQVLLGGTARTRNVQASVSGGNKNTRFMLSSAHNTETTVFPGDFGYRRNSTHLNLNHTSENNKLRIDIAAGYTTDQNKLIMQNLVPIALTLPPNAPELRDADGNLNWANATWQNPLSYLEQNYRSKSRGLTTNGVLRFEMTDYLSAKLNLGLNSLQIEQIEMLPSSFYNPASNQALSESYFGNDYQSSWIAEPQLEYRRLFGELRINAFIGGTFQQSSQESNSMAASGFLSDALLENIQAASNLQILSSNQADYRYTGAYLRLNSTYKNKLLINLTARRDGSSRFGPDKKFANFWAIGTGYILTEENLLNSSSFLTFAKFRASYGTTGNDQIPNYGYMDTYSVTSTEYNGNKGFYPTRLANRDFSWETNKKLEVAWESRFFRDRLTLDIAWYRNRSSNQLVGYPLSAVTGGTSIQFNLPASVQNTGWEFELSSANISNGPMRWSTAFNLTVPKNKLLSYPNLEGSSYANRYVVGEPLNLVKVYRYLGVNEDSGVFRFEDLDNDGILSSSNDLQPLKTVGQIFFGGMQNILSYKGLNLDFFIQFVRQTGYNYRYSTFTMPGSALNNQPVEVLERWQTIGDITDTQRFSQRRLSSNPVYKAFTDSQWYGENTISDASFLRLKNISISWQLPQAILKALHTTDIQIFALGQNILTFTRYRGLDPEQQSIGYLPPLRTITVGTKLIF